MSPAAPSDLSPIGLAILVALASATIAWAAVQFVRAWRARRARARPEPMAWLRAMDPSHPALPTPTRQAPMLPASRRWTLGRVAIYAAQAVAIGWLTWICLGGAEPNSIKPEASKGFIVLLMTSALIVAFATAVLTNLWAWVHGEFQRTARSSRISRP